MAKGKSTTGETKRKRRTTLGLGARKDDAVLTPARIEVFLSYVAAQGGNVTRAARMACEDIPETARAHAAENLRKTMYTLCKDDAALATAFEEAKRLGVLALEDEARRRAFNGVTRNVHYQGEVVDTVTEFSDSLMCTLLKAHMPDKYKDRTELSGSAETPVAITVDAGPEVKDFLATLREG